MYITRTLQHRAALDTASSSIAHVAPNLPTRSPYGPGPGPGPPAQRGYVHAQSHMCPEHTRTQPSKNKRGGAVCM